ARNPPEPLSFPTRRSSDLIEMGLRVSGLRGAVGIVVGADELRFLVVIKRDRQGAHRHEQRLRAQKKPAEPRVAVLELPRPKRHRSEEHTSELQSPCNLVCR